MKKIYVIGFVLLVFWVVAMLMVRAELARKMVVTIPEGTQHDDLLVTPSADLIVYVEYGEEDVCVWRWDADKRRPEWVPVTGGFCPHVWPPCSNMLHPYMMDCDPERGRKREKEWR